MKDGYDIFEREGNLHLRAWGKDEQELFHRALLGLAAVMRPDVMPRGREVVRTRTHITAGSLSELLGRFLAHAAFEGEMQDAVFSAMHVIHFSPKEIECELLGKKIDHWEEVIDNVQLSGRGIERFSDRWEMEGVITLV